MTSQEPPLASIFERAEALTMLAVEEQ